MGVHLNERLTCCAVSILSFSRSSAWKPFNSTSSVDAGTVVVKVRKDREVRLQRSSIGNCMKPRYKPSVIWNACTGNKQHGFRKTHSRKREMKRTQPDNCIWQTVSMLTVLPLDSYDKWGKFKPSLITLTTSLLKRFRQTAWLCIKLRLTGGIELNITDG